MTYSDDLPQISVVFIFVNEALSVILRSVHSVVNLTPSQLLKEVILVDDNSDNVQPSTLSTPSRHRGSGPLTGVRSLSHHSSLSSSPRESGGRVEGSGERPPRALQDGRGAALGPEGAPALRVLCVYAYAGESPA
ncbi:hypothetical protein J1605_011522 [Eschrichtius robustus]|uniref:Glycosyltransferase 2-like domain-containing protein n=1 Tax=Eschrichtius robustus TaxID=9764 RepID=A0AB34GJS9_ESCRO|nr:hypothetical protein J1605_011522 [Eschrichtius robustus]